MNPPIIAITQNRKLADYEEAVRRAGGEPRVVSPDDPVDATLASADGVLLTGGEDVDPSLYGEDRHPTTKDAESGRDAFEIALARRAVERDVPLLAICRGVQVLNVAFGGTLVQDIPSQLGASLEHSVQTPAAIAHDVRITAGSRLWEVLDDAAGDASLCSVNSRHHQSINKVAPGFDVAAVAPDGVIEAIERPEARFCIGVQWHPENFWATGEFDTLFERFVRACGRT